MHSVGNTSIVVQWASLILPQVKEFWDKKSEEFGAVNLEEVEWPLQLDINQLTLDEDKNTDI